MLRICLFTLGLLAVSVASASEVKINSFRFLESGVPRSPAAEICGELVTPTGRPEMIKIVSDPSSKTPGQYFAWAGKEGKFCHIIATYTGNAGAELAQ